MKSLGPLAAKTGTTPGRLSGLSVLSPRSFVSIHEHIQIDLRKDAHIGNNFLLDPALAVEELKEFAAGGGDVVVDQTPYGLGKTRREIKDIAESAGVDVIFGCGWYRGPYLDERVEKMSTDALADVIVDDLLYGDADGISPGVIGEIGSQDVWISPGEERVLRAAARAHHKTGAAIATHVPNPSRLGLEQLRILCDEEGVAPERIIIGHGSGYGDPTYHFAVIERGAFISFDRMGVATPVVVRQTSALIRAIVDAGGSSRLLFGHDVCYKSDLIAFGGSGYGALSRQPESSMLAAWNLDESQYLSIMTYNPWKVLTGHDPSD
jgi:phosphotriesterase-related protein